MQPGDKKWVTRLLRGLGWVAAFLLVTGLGAFTGCLGAGGIGSLIDKQSPNAGKGIEGAGATLLLGFGGMVVGGFTAAAVFEHQVRKRFKRGSDDKT